MHELHWQKSTFSGGPQGECITLAAAPDGTIRLRESDAPRTVLTATPHELAALLRGIKCGASSGLRSDAALLGAGQRRPGTGHLPRQRGIPVPCTA
jgi:hypothetical protein